MTTEAKLARLDMLEASWKSCASCALGAHRTRVVMWRGSPDAKIFMIGEAPGAEEDAQGMPFVGLAGKALDEMLAEAGLSPKDDLFIANVVACRPPNNRIPLMLERMACRPRLEAMLQVVQPKVLVLLGATAARLAGITTITRWRGTPTEVEMAMYNKAIGSWPAIATYHPSYLLRNGNDPRMRAEIIGDFRRAQEMVDG